MPPPDAPPPAADTRPRFPATGFPAAARPATVTPSPITRPASDTPPPPPDASPTSPNALAANNELKGSNSYYYAHASSNTWAVPADARTIEGEGLTHTGAGPRRLDGAPADDAAADDDATDAVVEGLRQEISRLRARLGPSTRVDSAQIKNYSFSDGEDSVKVYVELEAAILRSRRTADDGSARRCLDAGAAATFWRRKFRLVVTTPSADGPDERRCLDVNLHDEVIPKQCSYKIVVEKGRVVVTLRKALEKPWPCLSG